MPSNLRIQRTFDNVEATHSYFPSAPSPPLKKQKMSLTQTYYIAASARSKLGKEACRPDHDLRLLVGHANLLDSLMLELADAEREQEAWFNQTVKTASRDEPKQPARQHIEWADAIMEDEEDEVDSDDDDAASDSSDDSDLDGDYEMVAPRAPSPSVRVSAVELAEDESDEEDFYEDDDDDESHALTRVSSRSSPPELIEDDESSDDDTPPASPPQASLEYEQPLYAKGERPLSPPARTLAKDSYFMPEQNNNLLIASF